MFGSDGGVMSEMWGTYGEHGVVVFQSGSSLTGVAWY